MKWVINKKKKKDALKGLWRSFVKFEEKYKLEVWGLKLYVYPSMEGHMIDAVRLHYG